MRYTIRTGPDDVETLIEFDNLGRVAYVRRGPVEDPIMEAAYTYYLNSLVDTVTFGNGSFGEYTYDNANRVTLIDYWANSSPKFALSYTYTPTNLPATVTEYVNASSSAWITYTYDTRSRLIEEQYDDSLWTSLYHLAYEYDQGGNRTKKTDLINDLQFVYVYDLSDPEEYGSANNRLMKYEKRDIEGGEPGTLLETTYYYYNDVGNVTYIVNEPAGVGTCPHNWTQYTADRLVYAQNGRTVTYAMKESWCWNGNPNTNLQLYSVDYVGHYRYDGARQRYLVQVLDPADFDVVLSERWSDYDGDDVYGDFEIDEGNGETVPSLELGILYLNPYRAVKAIRP